MKKKKILAILLISLMTVTISGITYAYFRATVTRTNQTTRVTTGIKRVGPGVIVYELQ